MSDFSYEDFLKLTWGESEKIAESDPVLYKYFTVLSKKDRVEAKSNRKIELQVLSPFVFKFKLFKILLEEKIQIRSINEKHRQFLSEIGADNDSNFIKVLQLQYYYYKDLEIGKFNSKNDDNFFSQEFINSRKELDKLKSIFTQPGVKLNKVTFQFIINNRNENLLIKSEIAKKKLLGELIEWTKIQVKAKESEKNDLGNFISSTQGYVSNLSLSKKIIAYLLLSMLQNCTQYVAKEGSTYSNKQLIIIGKIFLIFQILDSEEKYKEKLTSTDYSNYNQYLKQNIKDILSKNKTS